MGKLIVIDSDKLDEILYEHETELTNNLVAIFKKNWIAILTELQLEIDGEKQDTKHLHYEDLCYAESFNNGIDNCIDTIQQKINALEE